MSYKEYDVIFSMGEACSCTQILRDNNLQFCSYPLDWLYGSNFEGRIEILKSEFKNFINKDDLEYKEENPQINRITYYNKFNDITFNHDFLMGLDFDEAYDQVKKKYDRRIKRLLNNIKKAKSILVVCTETTEKDHKIEDNELIVRCFNEFCQKYPDKKIDLYYLQNNLDIEFSEQQITDNITKYVFNYKKPDETLDYLVDVQKVARVFQDVKLKSCKHILLKNKINKFLDKPYTDKKCQKKIKEKISCLNLWFQL